MLNNALKKRFDSIHLFHCSLPIAIRCVGIALLLGIGLWGCAGLDDGAPNAKSNGCVSGNCKNGYGEYRRYEGKYIYMSKGMFKDGMLWDGKVDKGLANMDAIIIQEVANGKVIWERQYGK